LEFGSAELCGAALVELAGLLTTGRAVDLAPELVGRAELEPPGRLVPGATDGGWESRGAGSAVLGAAAEVRPSSGETACCGALGRKANATVNAKITANAAAPKTQLNGTAARCGLVRSLTGTTLSRLRSTRIVTAGELLRFARRLRSRSLGGGAATCSGALRSGGGCTLRPANGSRCVDALRKSKASS